jgi:hypothetical protein
MKGRGMYVFGGWHTTCALILAIKDDESEEVPVAQRDPRNSVALADLCPP